MKVAVVGMGAAGLRSALELRRAGIEVAAFEARDRVGGRIHTWTDSLAGVAYEAGAEWIAPEQVRTLTALAHYGIATVEAPTEPARLEFQGQTRLEDDPWREALQDDLRLEAAGREIGRQLRYPVWANTTEIDRNHQPLSEFLRTHAHSEVGRWWITNRLRSELGDDPDRLSALGWLGGFVEGTSPVAPIGHGLRVAGGLRRLVEAMRDEFDGEIQFGAILRKVERTSSGVKLRFEGFEETADRVVLTLPPMCLERVVFEPALSSSMRCAIEACEFGPAATLTLQFRRPWWKERGWSGGLRSDGPLQRLWESTLGEAPTLTASIHGAQARTWSETSDPVKVGLYVVSRAFPEAAEWFVQGWFHDWTNDPFSRGGRSHVAPGYALDHMAAIARREDAIHFAGEHTSYRPGTIEAAFESADRVVGEINAESTRRSV